MNIKRLHWTSGACESTMDSTGADSRWREVTMQYADGSSVSLGDVVIIPLPDREARARVVMLGDTGEHLDIDQTFLDWVRRDQLLDTSTVIVEWVDPNPLAHDEPGYAPVGNYLFTGIDCCVTRVDTAERPPPPP